MPQRVDTHVVGGRAERGCEHGAAFGFELLVILKEAIERKK
jgi:hypothetical protein